MGSKIKRCLYVGMGGTGMNALLHTKKMFVDTYGEVPPMIGFMGIDTDGNQYKKTLPSTTGEEISLLPNEQLPIIVRDPRPIYDVNREYFSWVPEKNLYALSSLNQGAGQVRTNGRFAFTVNYVQVAQKIRSILDQITNARIINNDKYELLGSDTEIHMIFSVCGGTGCGTFLNMAYLLRKEAPGCKLTGYAVLPDVFKSMSNSGMAKVAPNAYGAIQDLDYLMHMGIGSTPVKLEYIRDSYEIKDRPFNSVVFIDNKNENNDSYTHIDELTEMISLALVTSAGELSTASASVSDNLEKNIAEGSMDIENKKAWAAGMGVCEILYKSSSISKIYSIKAAKSLIERLQNTCEDIDVIVNSWIDSEKVNIRENNNNDHVIDFIAEKNPKYDITINEYANPTPEIQQYIAAQQLADEFVSPKITSLTSRVRKELRELLVANINKECGVSTAAKIIEGIRAQVNLFIGEMQKEKEDFVDKEPRLRTAMETAVADLKEYDSKFFKKSSTLEDRATDVADAVRQLVVCQREIVRRTSALTVFNNILSMLQIAEDKVKVIHSTLDGIYKKFTSDLSKIQNSVGKTSRTFQIDLALEAASKVSVKQEDIQISDFVRTLINEGKIYGFHELSSDEVEDMLLRYTSRTHVAKSLAETTIDQIIDKLSEDDFKHVVELAVKKSMPLFRYNYRGYAPKENPRDSFYVGVPNKATSRLFKDNYFKGKIHGTADVDFANIGVNDRIIIYRQVGVVPAYAISSIQEYKREYEDCNVNCHFDNNMLRRMVREEYALDPKRASDDDLLEMWVKGFVFGLVRNDNGTYQFQSQELGDALDDNWVDLGKYRDEAYDEFRRNKAVIFKEFTDIIESLVSQKGQEAVLKTISDVKVNYLDGYSQINMTKDQIKAKGFERIRELITQELDYVKKHL